ncbi:MAG: hypothetical protein IPG70_07835 [Moraxellaceae bacterium]|nr:hypothetical protein [Moraxellaceae bacterium]
MGFFSDVCSAVGSFVSGVCSAAVSVFNGVASVATGVLSLAKVLPLPPQVEAFLLVVKVIDIVCKALGILDADDSTEDLGDRALQAEEAGIKPENFETYQEYKAAIDNFQLDPEKSAKYKTEEKMAAGLGVEFWALEDKFGQGAGDLLTHMVKDGVEGGGYFSKERLDSFLGKVESVADVAKYFSKTLSPDDNSRVEQKLVDAEKALNPDKTNTDIYRELDIQRGA